MKTIAILLFVALSLTVYAQNEKLTIAGKIENAVPLQEITLVCSTNGTITITDGVGNEYFKSEAANHIKFKTVGALGKHTVTLTGSNGKIIAETSFNMDLKTEINDGGKMKELFDILYNGMMEYARNGYDEFTWQGKTYRFYVTWVLDNNNVTKGMQYFYPYSGDMVDLFRLNQQPNGMIWSFINNNDINYHYYNTAYSPINYYKKDADAWWVRQPNENHVEYNFVNLMYQHWKSSGNTDWMKQNLDCAARALDYSVTDTVRWSKRFQLLKRPLTIDSWDFQVDDEYTPMANITATMVVVPGKTKYGVFFGDNTGYFEACNQLAEMFEFAGNSAMADRYRKRGKEILDRLIALSWNGKFFTHFIDEDPTVKRNLGVDMDAQIAQGNCYSVNRGLSHEMIVKIINTYQELRKNLPVGSPGEWYAIYPPFERGFEGHNAKWQYMNGGMAGHAIGELARGAYENGYEDYASDMMDRMLQLSKKYGNKLWFAYTGSITPPPPAPKFRFVDISKQTNMDLWDVGSDKVFTWMNAGKGTGNDMRGLPTGKQTFKNIQFNIIDPVANGRKAAIAVSTKQGFPRQTEVMVNDTAQAIYLLHSSSDNIPANVSGAVTFIYADGSEASRYIFKEKEITNWWFSHLESPNAGVAWWGPNLKSSKVGVCWAAIDNPHPEKTIAKIAFSAPLEGGIYAVLAVSLADRPFYIAPKGESFGGPDNWAAANGMAALVEGLAGVKNEGLAFDKVKLSPRWTSAKVDSVNVAIRFATSNGYVAYQYKNDAVKKMMDIEIAGSGNELKAHILLPASITKVKQVMANNISVPFTISSIENSNYVDFSLTLNEVRNIEIYY
jgi:hypothetical protein